MPDPGGASTTQVQVMLQRISNALLLLSLVLYGGTIVELFAAKHYDERTQLIPFAMSAVGAICVVAAWLRPTPRSRRLLQVVLAVALIVSGLGIYFHVTANIAFLTDFQPDASWSQRADAAVHGRDPLLAPGILALASGLGVLGLTGLSLVAKPVATDLPTELQTEVPPHPVT